MNLMGGNYGTLNSPSYGFDIWGTASEIGSGLLNVPIEYAKSPDGTRIRVGNIVYEKKTGSSGNIYMNPVANVGDGGGMPADTETKPVTDNSAIFAIAAVALLIYWL